MLSSAAADLVVARPEGLYCPAGDFFIDPWRPVHRALITHAHSDHARSGSASYLAVEACAPVLRARLGETIELQTLRYGERIRHNGVEISFHPAGHVLGSAQIRLAHDNRTWVVSGDYKLEDDGTCPPFEPVRCDTFISESTFGLPIYRWQSQPALMAEIDAWWRTNAAAGRPSVLYCYAFGKAQRILHGIDASIGPIVAHGAMQRLNQLYRDAGVRLPPAHRATEVDDRASLRQALIIAPPSAQGTPWLKRFPDYSDAFASGWMQLRGTRRRRGVDRGFALSDHADWPGLLQAIRATGAGRVIVTHGHVTPLIRWLCEEEGLDAHAFATEYGDEEGEAELADAEAPPAPAAPLATEEPCPGEPEPELDAPVSPRPRAKAKAKAKAPTGDGSAS